MEILGELAWCIDNAELLADLPDEVYERIIFCTLVPDVEVSFVAMHITKYVDIHMLLHIYFCRCCIVALRRYTLYQV